MNSNLHEIAQDRSVRIASAPYLLATKLEAFLNRGANNLWLSHDITDIVALVDGRPEILEELQSAPPASREFVRGTLKILLDSGLDAAVEAHLPSDPFSAPRAQIVVERLRRLAGSES